MPWNPSFGGGWRGAADFAVKLNSGVAGSAGSEAAAVFSMAGLGQKPTIVYQPGPAMSKELRRKAPGKVNVIFIVDENGRVADARVRSSTDPVSENPALKAVKKWKFEPGAVLPLQSGDVAHLSQLELELWNSPAFQKYFTESHLAETGIEPAITQFERDKMMKVLEFFSAVAGYLSAESAFRMAILLDLPYGRWAREPLTARLPRP